MREKIKKSLELIIGSLGIIISSTLLAWGFYDTLKSRIEIEKEAKARGTSIYQVCKEKGRSDVLEMIEIEKGMKNIRYIYTDVIIPIYNPK